MIIEEIKVFPYQAHRVYKTITADLGGVPKDKNGIDVSNFYLVEMTTNEGYKGYGEVSDVPDYMTLPKKAHLNAKSLEKYLSNQFMGMNVWNFEEILSHFPHKETVDKRTDGTVYDILGCGIDNALLDLLGKKLKTPVYNLLGGKKRESVPVSWVVYIRDISLLEDEIRKKVYEGFKAFKLKVGLDEHDDEERLRIIREVAGDQATIKLDANSGWTYDQAVQNLKRLKKYNPDGVETPIAYLDVEGKAKLRKQIDIPIIEHAHDLSFAFDLVSHRAVDVFNLSTVGSGGIWKSKKIMTIAEGEGVPCLLGSTIETGLGTAAQLQLGANSDLLTWPSDLVGPKMYTEEFITLPHQWKDNQILIPQGGGLGVIPELNK
ncbi:mandelate racemase/muconate lactonizing enzyme family protein [Natribacillus halophilus]|uniref:Muconate cycloisomerase n=1 Tax=Natribacillus halophilus TaxID=549003 RepID=A0A1G8REP8_9BACI|nr:enolase C-terminal domain-like protein [Natribacillus halophilus]SDJ14830.1 muconate cycloisomerase [Natribacillus halophilus]